MGIERYMEPRCPRGLRTGGLDSGGEKGQTPICVSVVWKSRSQLRRRRGDEASWVVGAASSLQSARLLKSRRATRYLVAPPDAPTEGHEGHEGGWRWRAVEWVCARWSRNAGRCYRGKLPAAVHGLLPNSVPTRWQRAGMGWKQIPRKKKVGDGEGEERSRREATRAR